MVRRSPLRSLDDNAPAHDQAALVRDMLAGSRRAWLAFHARYHVLVLRVIEKVTARFARRMAEDDVREICATMFVQLCANDMGKLRSFDGDHGNKLGSWVGLLAVNCAYDHLRTLRHAPSHEPLDAIEDMLEDAPTPDEVLDRKERLEIAAEVLRELSEKDRQFVALYFDEGLDVEQIAERMQISVKTVYSKKHKIQSRIEARINEPRAAERLAA